MSDKSAPSSPDTVLCEQCLSGLNNDCFDILVDPFIRACPGPDLAVRGLRLMAHQEVFGVVSSLSSSQTGESPAVLRTLTDIANQLYCTPGHLSRLARERGYSYSHALRWIRLLFGIFLLDRGTSGDEIARRLGLADGSSWSRFSARLTGKTPSQLPRMPVHEWVRIAKLQVFLTPVGPGLPRPRDRTPEERGSRGPQGPTAKELLWRLSRMSAAESISHVARAILESDASEDFIARVREVCGPETKWRIKPASED